MTTDTLKLVMPRVNTPKESAGASPPLSSGAANVLVNDLERMLVSLRSNGQHSVAQDLLGKLCVIFERFADNEPSAEGRASMNTRILGTLSLAVGHVVTDRDQPVRLIINRLRDRLSEIERKAEEINREIREGLPILGDRSSPYPITQADEESLLQLSYVIASRTHEVMQLSPLPHQATEILASR